MSSLKKKIRSDFRNAVFNRDNNRCKACGNKDLPLDAHHITDRNLMPNGGYVADNGISLCPQCHEFAEEYHNTGIAKQGYSPHDLYVLIGSSLEKAIKSSERLKI